jgi:hypothetical protein
MSCIDYVKENQNTSRIINIVQKSCRKHFWIVSKKELLPFMVGQSQDSFTLLSVKAVMLFQPCQQVILVLCTEYRQEALWSKSECQVTCMCAHEWVTSKKKSWNARLLPPSVVQISHDFVGSKREVNPYADFFHCVDTPRQHHSSGGN